MGPHPSAPAFPAAGSSGIYLGMSVRTWLAGQALAGLAQGVPVLPRPADETAWPVARWAAVIAVQLADATIEALGGPARLGDAGEEVSP